MQVANGIFPVTNTTKITVQTKTASFVIFTKDSLPIVVDTIPLTNIKTGLDLSGGARALVKPERAISAEELDDLIAITSTRLNEFGISDVSVRGVTDLSANNFMLVEVVGATTDFIVSAALESVS
jgi:preprotein translocase subunit SecD